MAKKNDPRQRSLFGPPRTPSAGRVVRPPAPSKAKSKSESESEATRESPPPPVPDRTAPAANAPPTPTRTAPPASSTSPPPRDRPQPPDFSDLDLDTVDQDAPPFDIASSPFMRDAPPREPTDQSRPAPAADRTGQTAVPPLTPPANRMGEVTAPPRPPAHAAPPPAQAAPPSYTPPPPYRPRTERSERLPVAGTREHPLTVAQLTGKVRLALEGRFPMVFVTGEVSNASYHNSGNIYFSLKDADSQLKCVIFRDDRPRFRFRIEDGMELILQGRIGVFTRQGAYQFYVDAAIPTGKGALQIQFDALKQRLASEGLFDAKRKRPIPRMARRIGVVTSASGAALKDFVNVATRRWPGAHLIIAPVQVQGRGAAQQVAEAIDALNRHGEERPANGCDVLVVTRGGGSVEDLFTFNDEVIVRAIARSRLPVVTGIGHEIDVTLADHAADHRALTPSDAAARVTPDGRELRRRLDNVRDRLNVTIQRDLVAKRDALTRLGRHLEAVSPQARLREWTQTLDGLAQSMTAAIRARLLRAESRLHAAEQRLRAASPAHAVDRQQRAVDAAAARLHAAMRGVLAHKRSTVDVTAARLEALSPLQVLTRGYSLTQPIDANTGDAGPALTDVTAVKPGDAVRTRLARGWLTSRIETTGDDTDASAAE